MLPRWVRFIGVISVFLLWGAVAVPFSYGEEALTNGEARLSFSKGDVVMQSVDVDEWVATSNNMPLRVGDRLWAPDNGRLEVQFMEGTFVRGDKATGVDFLDLNRGEKEDFTRMAVSEGRANFEVKGWPKHDTVFQVDTPNASLRCFDSSNYRVWVNQDGTTTVAVISGEVKVESEQGSTELEEGEAMRIYADKTTELIDPPAYDELDQWAEARDKARERALARTKRYVPESVPGGEELADNGTFERSPEYGYVWRPRVAVGWTPFSDGRWLYEGPDPVWVGYEPWGWAPYHYGRWVYWGSAWAWVPPPAPPIPFIPIPWCPGAVTWVSSDVHVGWLPLAPGEVWYGTRFYGPSVWYSSCWTPRFYGASYTVVNNVNITNIHVTNINVYKNYHVKGAFVGVPRDVYLKGGAIRAHRVEAAKFANLKTNGVHINPKLNPSLKPIKASFHPRPDVKIAKTALPPKRVNTAKSWENKRTLAKTPTISAVKPGKTVKPLSINKDVRSDKTKAAKPLINGKVYRPAGTSKGAGKTGVTGTGKTGITDTGKGKTTGTGKTGTLDTGKHGTTGTGKTGITDTGKGKTGTMDTGKGKTTGTGKTGTLDTGKHGTTGTGKTGTTGIGKTGTTDTGKGKTTGTGKTGTLDTGKHSTTGTGKTGTTGTGKTGTMDTGKHRTTTGTGKTGTTGTGKTGITGTGKTGTTGKSTVGTGKTGTTGKSTMGTGKTGTTGTGKTGTGTTKSTGKTGTTKTDDKTKIK